MWEIRTCGPVRGVLSNGHPYRDRQLPSGGLAAAADEVWELRHGQRAWNAEAVAVKHNDSSKPSASGKPSTPNSDHQEGWQSTAYV